MNLYGYEFQRDSDLAHYGVIGMKWGVRRYQQANGRLTPEGRKHLKAEARADNKQAFELGKKATLSGKALQKEYKKLQNTKLKNVPKEKAVYNRLKQIEARDRENVEKHHSKLVEKYGKDFVSDIKKTKMGSISERTVRKRDIVKYAAITGLLAVPIGIVSGTVAGTTFAFGPIADAIIDLGLATSVHSGTTSLIGGIAGGTVGAAVGSTAKNRKDDREVNNIRSQNRKAVRNTNRGY